MSFMLLNILLHNTCLNHPSPLPMPHNVGTPPCRLSYTNFRGLFEHIYIANKLKLQVQQKLCVWCTTSNKLYIPVAPYYQIPVIRAVYFEFIAIGFFL